MIRVTIELVPYGSEIRRSVIGQILVRNDGTGNRDIGNYEVLVQEIDDPERRTKRFHINNFRRSRRMFALLKEVLEAYASSD